jgi:hypothetical protein
VANFITYNIGVCVFSTRIVLTIGSYIRFLLIFFSHEIVASGLLKIAQSKNNYPPLGESVLEMDMTVFNNKFRNQSVQLNQYQKKTR